MTAPETKPLSKREFLNGLACQTMAFLDREGPGSSPDAGLRWKFFEGNQIGAIAREVIGPGRMLPPFGDTALQESAAALASTSERLYEVTMSAGGLLARADAMLPTENGWELVEVKSSKMPEKGVPKPEHIDDAAFTLLVAQWAGVQVSRVTLMLLSRAYVAGADLPLLEALDITAEATARAVEFNVIAPDLVRTLSGSAKPAPSLSMTCKECAYFDTRCIGVGIEDSVLRIPRLNEKKLNELLPHVRIATLPDSVSLTPAQRQVVDLVKRGGVERDDDVLSNLLRVQWPVHYLDFEAVMPAIPWFEGDTTYATWPHQFSIHTRATPLAEPTHVEYLASVDGDWRRELAERLVSSLHGEGSIMVYSSYEKTRLNALSVAYPDLAEQLERIVARLFDLEPFFKNGYIDYRFAGSSSIKKVLPVMVPSLSYEHLAVGNGTVAAAIFSFMKVGEVPSAEHDARRRELLEYCALDTMAMVRLHDALLGEIRST
ncbi:MAG: DUF2779 domain-containing protein [Gemmatimonadetes bacterium]|nr:DUF2779 domain-containing protein [Gemmatimonadota bacterium]